MGFLKCLLYTLQVLAVLLSVSVFTFDAQQRRFRQHAKLKLWLKVVHLWILLPSLCLIVAALLFIIFSAVLDAVHNLFQGSNTMFAITTSQIMSLASSRYMLLIYIIYLYKKRVGELEQLLNEFVSIYDQYVALFGPKLHINWLAGVAMFFKMFAIDFIFWIFCFVKPNVAFIVVVYATMGAPIMGLFTSLVALLLLNALFRGVTLSKNNIFWQQCLHRRRTQKLLRFYNDLLTLRDNLEKCLKPFFVAQLLAEAICILPPIEFMQQVGLGIMPLIMLSLLYPCLHAKLCHDMVNAEQRMGNELLTLHCEHMDDEASKLVQIFCLQKLLKERFKQRSWRVLYLRKGFILQFIHISWINGMFLKTIAFSDSTVRTFDWRDQILHLEKEGERGSTSSYDS